MIKETKRKIERKLFRASLENPKFFRNRIRKFMYWVYRNPNKIHNKALRFLNEHVDILTEYEEQFKLSCQELKIDIKGKKITPLGTAAGLDKNGDALLPFSKAFGFLEPGTVILHPRKGNKEPNIVVDDKNEDIFNAQGFPSLGLEYFVEKIHKFREGGHDAPIYVSICGLPKEGEVNLDRALGEALEQTIELVSKLNHYVDGFVWNPFSPNTKVLEALRDPKIFLDYGELFKGLAEDKLKLIKMGPYNEQDKNKWLELCDAWLYGGGEGLVVVNTYKVPREEIPSKKWGYESAGRSGRFLKYYRLNAVRDARETFPEAIIFATGGIYTGEDAYSTFIAGADAVECYTPLTFYGLGLEITKRRDLLEQIKAGGHNNLEELIMERRRSQPITLRVKDENT